MNFMLDDDCIMVGDLVKDYATKTLHPLFDGPDGLDRNHEKRIPAEVIREMGELGFFGIILPEEYGGMNLSYKVLATAAENITRYSRAGIAQSLISGPNCAYGAPFVHFGTPEQKEEYLPKIVTGECQGAMAITEPSGSSAVSSMKTTAVPDGNDYVINGSKVFITRADTSEIVLTIAMTKEGPACFIVPKDTPGLIIDKSEEKMGLRGLGLNPVSYMDCRVPKEFMLGKPGQGLEVAIDSLYEVRTLVAAGAIGMAQAAIDLAKEYAQQRILKGHKLASFQNTQFELAKAQTKVDAGRLLYYRSAEALDAGKGKEEFWKSSMAKYYCSEICGEVVDKCLQVFGGYGYCKDYEIERIYRDVRVNRILDGASEIHLRLISKWMGVR